MAPPQIVDVPQRVENEVYGENQEVIAMQKGSDASRQLPPRTPNYGKTPKYIEKFKEEAKQKAL